MSEIQYVRVRYNGTSQDVSIPVPRTPRTDKYRVISDTPGPWRRPKDVVEKGQTEESTDPVTEPVDPEGSPVTEPAVTGGEPVTEPKRKPAPRGQKAEEATA